MSAGVEDAKPTPRAERDPAIDALRGLCLLGIALVNVPWIGSPRSLAAYLFDDGLREATPIWDLIAAVIIEWTAEGKFYPQFSALFGFGAGVLMARGWGIYGRRIAVLMVFGLLHASFGWWGDILINYAVVGACLPLLYFLPNRALLGFSILTLIAGCVLSYLYDGWLVPDLEGDSEYMAENIRIYAHGSFWEITEHRVHEIAQFFDPWNRSYRMNTLTMASFGLWVERAGLLNDLSSKRRQLKIAAIVLCSLGLVMSLGPWLYILGGDVLGMGWAALFLWVATGKHRASLLVLAPVGRMAITAYLLQTVIFTLTFYSYGLGFYGRFSPLAGALLALGVWWIEVGLSRLWLEHFALGPVEWLWRSLTYLKPIPMRRAR